ncbi:MAG: hydroxymethylbilane synthase, partial [Proteobacteria bacterium]|nr:hydroxymethylbilane synthase [Pseudomonadota bacterium]NDD05581.1 hydroxymethylbilane synthase [Pseudomonadota bacterium]
MKYRLGTRKSALAVAQAEHVQKLLKEAGCLCEIIFIESEGDKNLNTPLYEIESMGPGLFTKQLEKALLENKIDLAVHSLKDLPTSQPESLKIAAITQRVAEQDCLIVSKSGLDESQELKLKHGARVGTSSLRRQAQLKAVRPDLTVVSLRGNVPTRIEAVKKGDFDAVVLAEAGLKRLGLSLPDLNTALLPVEKFVPAPGQGALAIEVRANCPKDLLEAICRLNNKDSEIATRIERTILKELEGGCTLPLGVYCRREGKSWKLNAFLGVPEGELEVPRGWKSFHRFDILNAVEQTL